MKSQFGKLTRIENLRPYWELEARDFTPWLADAENLQLLADALGIDEFESDSIQTEQDAGDFRIDIVAKTDQDELVIIENQLDRTDHKHLGQLITYASGRNAKYIVWIAQKLRDEHRAALQWLNDLAKNSEEKIGFWGVEIELWRINESQPAPRLNVIVQPNSWATSVGGDPETSTRKIIQYEFWTKFKDYCIQHDAPFKVQEPRPQHWSNIAVGRSGFHLAATVKTSTNQVGCELYVERPTARPWQARAAYDELFALRGVIECELGNSLIWPTEAPVEKAWRIVEYRDVDLSNKDEWPSAHQWLTERIVAFRNTFRPIIANLELEPDIASANEGG